MPPIILSDANLSGGSYFDVSYHLVLYKVVVVAVAKRVSEEILQFLKCVLLGELRSRKQKNVFLCMYGHFFNWSCK